MLPMIKVIEKAHSQQTRNYPDPSTYIQYMHMFVSILRHYTSPMQNYEEYLSSLLGAIDFQYKYNIHVKLFKTIIGS